MRLPNTTTYEEWNALRHKRFDRVPGFKDITIEHFRYETHLFMYESGISNVAVWDIDTGNCCIKTRREAIFSLLYTMRNYMLNGLDAWEFEDGKNVDLDLPWGVLFSDNRAMGHKVGTTK